MDPLCPLGFYCLCSEIRAFSPLWVHFRLWCGLVIGLVALPVEIRTSSPLQMVLPACQNQTIMKGRFTSGLRELHHPLTLILVLCPFLGPPLLSVMMGWGN